ncbi:MAG: SURF1 family protein [Intrasporangiaceae bacterium]|nr:SURF1 family protein [Intrasporangiaceae bacterium]
MIRTALRPKWLGALLLAVVFAVICGLLGNWQLREARAEARAQEIERAAAMPIQPLTEVVQPQSAFPPDGSTRRITATGAYDADGQVLIADRRLDGELGYWVVTPLVVQETGASLPVLRGFVTAIEDAPAPPEGGVDIGGGLAPGESPMSEADLPDGVFRSIDMSLLINRWDTAVYNAFVFLTDESQDGKPVALDGIERVPPPTGDSAQLNLKNAMYALQWWVFAAFGFFLWWRTVRQAHLEETQPDGDSAPGDQPVNSVSVTSDPVTEKVSGGERDAAHTRSLSEVEKEQV